MEKNIDGAAAVDLDLLEDSLDDYDLQLSTITAKYLKLPGSHRQIIRCFIENYGSGDMLTNSEIARKSGVDRSTVSKAMINQQFIDCMAEILPQVMKAKTTLITGELFAHAKKSWKAVEFWTKFTGEYTPTERRQSVHVNINQFADDDAGKLDNILTKLLDLGHNPDDIYMRMCELTGRVVDGEITTAQDQSKDT